MHYTVTLTKTAQKQYQAIHNSKLKRGINRILEKLKEDPYQFKKLSGEYSHLHSAKTFSFRVLYYVQDKQLIVTVIAIAHRKDVYR